MEINNKNIMDSFYIISTDSSKKNGRLLDEHGNLKKDLKRNLDYLIIPYCTWKDCKSQYDKEILVYNVYNLFISFSCHGLSYKNIFVHGSEIVFDVIQALFVNKMFGIDSFRRMFDVNYEAITIDPMVNFEWFGPDTKKIVLVVKRKCLSEQQLDVLESIMVNDSEEKGQGGFIDLELRKAAENRGNSHRISEENIKLYNGLYTREDPENAKDIPKDLESFQSNEFSISTQQECHQESVGIRNIGNTCYMSSSIQCLNNCNIFSNFFIYYHNIFRNPSNFKNNRKIGIVELENNKHLSGNYTIIESWANLIISLNTENIASPRDLKVAMGSKNPIFSDFREQDAAEFIEALLTYIHDGLSYNNLNKDSNEEKNVEDNLLDRRSIDSGYSSHNEDNKNDLGSLEETLEREFSDLINSENSIISRLFYGMHTNFMGCKECGFRKHKSDLMMMLPLAIPNEKKYHPSTMLIRALKRNPEKILALLTHSIRELKDEVKYSYKIENSILAVEYSDNQAIGLISDDTIVKGIINQIYLYEYSAYKKYYLCKMYFYKYLFFKKKLPFDFLVEETNQKAEMFNRLLPFFSKDADFSKFLKNTIFSLQKPDSIFGIPVIETVFTDPKLIFGANFETLVKPALRRTDDLNLRDCLNHCFKPDVVELFCEHCQRKSVHEMRSRITKFPQYFIIHLKRFSYLNTGAKINTFVEFPQDNLKMGDNQYRLIGTSNHIEIGLGYGHYVSYIRKNDEWYCCNDSIISKAAYPDKSSAYILFYEKV